MDWEAVAGAIRCGLAILGAVLLLKGGWRILRAVRVWRGEE